jgi:hypothetical protein
MKGARTMKLYINGCVTGYEKCQENFAKSERVLQAVGFVVVNPLRLCEADTELKASRRVAIKEMLDCDGVALLDDWPCSRYSKIVHDLALDLGMKVMSCWDWALEEIQERRYRRMRGK